MLEDYRNKKKAELAPEIPTTREGLVKWLKEELRCPLPVEPSQKFYTLRTKLIGLWRNIIRKRSVDDEWYHIYDEEGEFEFQVDQDTDDELERMVRNLAPWINDAKEEFLKAIAPLQAKIADDGIYPKHILRKDSLSVNEIKKLAKQENASYLFDSLNPEVLFKVVLEASKKLLEPIVSQRGLKFSVICDCEVGITKIGIATNCLMVEINEQVIHAYPCSLEEAQNKVGIFEITYGELYDYYYEGNEENSDEQVSIELSVEMKLSDLI